MQFSFSYEKLDDACAERSFEFKELSKAEQVFQTDESMQCENFLKGCKW